jgi:hypothetical protein
MENLQRLNRKENGCGGRAAGSAHRQALGLLVNRLPWMPAPVQGELPQQVARSYLLG